jgi:hypothetical protein
MRPVPIAFLLAASPALFAQAPALTVDQILAKHFEAEGGLARRKAVKSMRLTGKLVGMPMEIAIAMEARRPAAFRQDVTVQGQSQITAFDGKAGWRVNPFGGYGGSKAAEPFTEDELKEAQVQADMDGPLVDYAAKGHKVEYLGTESVEGAPAHKLRITLSNGNSTVSFLDADSFLKVKDVSKRKMRGQDVEMETVYGDYKEVGGLLFPHSLEVGGVGMPQRQKIQFDKVELDVAIGDDRFKAPPAPKPEEAKPAAGEAPKAGAPKADAPKAEPKPAEKKG